MTVGVGAGMASGSGQLGAAGQDPALAANENTTVLMAGIALLVVTLW